MTLEKPISEEGEGERDALPSTDIAAPLPASRARKSWLHRIVVAMGALVLSGVLLVAGGLAALLYLDIESSPIVGEYIRAKIVDELQGRLDPSLRVSIDGVDIKRGDDETFVDVSGFQVRDVANRSVVRATSGRVIIATGPLFTLRIVPVAINLKGLHADIEVAQNGTIAVVNGGLTETPPAAPAQPVTPAESMQQLIGGAFAAIAAVRESVGGKLPDVGIEGASVAVVDRRINRRFDINGITSRLQTYPDGASTARVEFRSGQEPVAVDLHLSAANGDSQTLRASAERLKLAELFRQLGIATTIVERDATGAIQLDAEVDRNARAKAATMAVSFGPAKVTVDRKVRPIPFEAISMRMSWSEKQNDVSIDEVAIDSEGSKVRLSGTIAPPALTDGPWAVSLNDAGSILAPLAPGEKPIKFDQLSATLAATPQTRTLQIEKVVAKAGLATAELSGRLYGESDWRPAIDLTLAARNVDARVGMRLWPIFAATEVRTWLVGAVKGGQLGRFDLKMAFSADALQAAVDDRPIPAEALSWSYAGTRGIFQPLAGMTPVSGLTTEGSGNGRTADISASSGVINVGQGRQIVLSDAAFNVADVSKKPAEGRLRLKFASPIDAALEFLQSPAMQPYAPKGLEGIRAKGDVDGELQAALRLQPHTNPGDARVTLNARLKNVSIDEALGEKIEGGNFTLTADKDAFTLKGDAKLLGSPAAIEVKGGGKGPAIATAALTLDDAARARKGMNFGSSVTGPAAIKLTTKLEGDNSEVQLDVDLSRMAISGSLPGLTKRAGAPGRLRAVASSGDKGGWQLDKMEFDAGSVSARGSISIGDNGELQKASLSQVKFSQGDVMQMDVERAGAGIRINAKGNSFDARPFLKSLLTGGIDKSGGKEFDLNMRSTVLSGFNGELLANADLKLQMRPAGLQRFELAGRFDGGNIIARLQPGKNAGLTIVSDDGGAFFRFFDLYNRMRGGRMDLTAQLSSGGQAGHLIVKNFALRDEPALKRLVADGSTPQGGDSARLQIDLAKRLRDAHDVPFTRMSISFVRTPGRLDIKEAVMVGPEVGGNLSGRMDYARDVVDLTGTFVPAFSLNNAIANVPVLGPIIAGGRNEGLFAVRYSINGKVSAPSLSINPLTAIAPGFLRKLIDFRGMGSNEPVAPPER